VSYLNEGVRDALHVGSQGAASRSRPARRRLGEGPRRPAQGASRTPSMTASNRRYRGLLLDFGGVITTDPFASINDHCERLGLRVVGSASSSPKSRLSALLPDRTWRDQPGCLRARACRPPGGRAGWVARRPSRRPAARPGGDRGGDQGAGDRHSGGVITNSWGTDPYDPYAGYHLGEHSDAVNISGEVGLRKPDPAIHRLAAEKLGLPPSACVFVDDVAANFPAAAELGMAAIHTSPRRRRHSSWALRTPQPCGD
jgi:putative hydrolase of the HAD superfamily